MTGGWTTGRRIAVLALVPLALLAASQLLRTPFHLSYRVDPAYVYLLNALNLAELAPPWHVDHPGTPVQLLGALVIRAEWARRCLVGVCAPVAQDVLADPERYLRLFQVVLAAGFCAALLLMGVALARACGVLPALCAQVTAAAFGAVVLRGLPGVSAEPMLATVAALLVAALGAPALGPRADAPGPHPTGRALAVGGILGLGIATKVTFVPLVGLAFLLKGARARALALAAVPLAFVACTLPAVSRYPAMFDWLGRLATHRGRYARGPAGLPGASELARNVATLAAGEPVLFALLGLCAAVALMAALRPPAAAEARRVRRVLLAVAAVVVLQVAITAKYTFPHYLLPAMMATPLAAAALVVHLRAPGPAAWRGAVAAALGLVLLFGVGRNLVTGTRADDEAAGILADRAAVTARIAAAPDCAVFEYYGATSIPYGLQLGDGFAGWRYSARLAALYPDGLFFNLWQAHFESWEHIGTYANVADHLAHGGCAFLVGERLTPALRADLGRHILLAAEIERPTQAAYRVLGFR